MCSYTPDALTNRAPMYAEVILEQLKHGTAKFELVSVPVPSISTPNSRTCTTAFLGDNSHRFFARIGPSLGGGSPAMRKLERYSVQKVTGDGRCLFRALVKGMAFNKGISLNPREERENADDLRMAVKEVVCDKDKERHQYEEALVAITVEESLRRYCQRIERPDFWGGESELLVLSKLCRQPIIVYIPEHEHTKGGWGAGFIPIAEYGAEFGKGLRKDKARKAVRLLYSGKNHYDLLV
ncbi:OVARIAN TUMOR DOMAIN-containing deubiquitinating enzyme 3 isoform X2 [Alnus glutinosa]|uniref:OVARIAN TUMOR DOMAIN-containing deubiquitinating enzyme 3 isoform X2 n=1 Tax=Alnus glutinosa TaxID=3517 RepID=UPI002D79FE98|nr:OVARIAN TUMOR DOMAIN-containing deubiquitinating enzyme 3 isoform X2 [Alnus glutinosa]